MGQYTYLKANTHLKKDKLEELAYLLSGMAGIIVHPTQDEEKNMGHFVCFPPCNISYEINEQDEIILKSSEKWTSYQDAKRFKFGAFNTIERVASYLGGVDVEIFSEEGITPPPNAVNGVYIYKTPVKTTPVNLDKNRLKRQVAEYLPVKINAELFYSSENSRFDGLPPYKAVKMAVRKFSGQITETAQFANVTAFLSYRGKEDTDFTEEELRQYLSRDNSGYVFLSRVAGVGSPVLVDTSMRCKGMEDFFKNIGREDLALLTKKAQSISDKRKRIKKKKDDFSKMFPKTTPSNCNWWTTTKENTWLKENEAVTITKYDNSDFYHMNFHSEIKNFPFGSESLSITIMPNESVVFVYKRNGIDDNTHNEIAKFPEKKKANSFYELLDTIKNPLFLQEVLDGIESCEGVSVEDYISKKEIETLRKKLPLLEERKKEQLQIISKMHIYLNVPFQEKDEAKLLGALWDPEKRMWFVPKDSDLSKYERWLPKQEEKEQDSEKDL